MPRLSAWFIRTALIYLASGFTFGMLLLFHKGVPLSPWMWRLLPLHVECMLIGWTVQLAMGVAFWILPRFGALRGNETPVWLAYGLINVGVLAVGLGRARRLHLRSHLRAGLPSQPQSYCSPSTPGRESSRWEHSGGRGRYKNWLSWTYPSAPYSHCAARPPSWRSLRLS